GLALGLWFCASVFRRPHWRERARLADPARLAKLLSVSTDITIRSVLLMAAFVSFTFFGARFGEVTLAANQVLMQFINLTSYALDGFAYAVEALVAQTIGARQSRAFRRATELTFYWGFGAALLMAAAFFVMGGTLIDLMTTSEEVRAEARRFLPWLIAMPLIAAGSFLIDGVFIGATRTRDMRNMMAVSFACYALAVAVLMPLLGNHGLWAALVVLFLARFVTLGARFGSVARSV
ncbi:MAG: MATE family efflux transporter, partial [Pseudomonadota bacterium]